MDKLLPHAGRAIAALKARHQTVVVAESSAGGLITAALLAVPGASACVRGGIVVYTYDMRRAILGISDAEMKGITPSTEQYALLKARRVRERVASDWALTETGAAGPTGSRYGYPPGHACFAVAGPGIERAITLETGRDDRVANMQAFAAAALDLLAAVVTAAPR
ncbi:MAG: putative competence-damaged protein, CinA like protein [Proteobacteria bacterium]|nr:putative competence-damaged protein, CinA like protein [Pseudomonadota bacterium]